MLKQNVQDIILKDSNSTSFFQRSIITIILSEREQVCYLRFTAELDYEIPSLKNYRCLINFSTSCGPDALSESVKKNFDSEVGLGGKHSQAY